MRRPAKCPTCHTRVPIPRDAEQGDEVTCPACDEVFVPKSLRKGHYDVRDEETYGVGAAAADPQQAEKKRKAKMLMAHGRSEHADRYKSGAAPVFGGAEMFLLILAAVCAIALPLGFVIAKRFPTQGEGALIILAYAGMVLGMGWRMLKARWRIGG
jgi:hypothetical protein